MKAHKKCNIYLAHLIWWTCRRFSPLGRKIECSGHFSSLLGHKKECSAHHFSPIGHKIEYSGHCFSQL
jgi:hypothetical protein